MQPDIDKINSDAADTSRPGIKVPDANRPDVSVIIAAYKAADTLPSAVASALAQDNVSVEVIVIDDCSGDDTAQSIAAFPADQVRLVTLQPNRGPGGARNVGLDFARGRWIAVLDADDTFDHDRLARLIARAEAADAQLAVDNLTIVGETGSWPMFEEADLAARPQLELAEFIAANIMFGKGFSYGYMKPLFNRAFIERHRLRYNEALRIGEDYFLFAAALAKGGRCVVDPQAGYRYNIRAGSISRVLERRHVSALLDVETDFLRMHKLNGAALIAQQRRIRSLRQAHSFLTLVEHLKNRAPIRAAATALRDPAALRLLKMPIEVRLRRLTESITGRRPSAAAADSIDTTPDPQAAGDSYLPATPSNRNLQA